MLQGLTCILGDLQVIILGIGDDIDCDTQVTAQQDRRVLLYEATLVQTFGDISPLPQLVLAAS